MVVSLIELCEQYEFLLKYLTDYEGLFFNLNSLRKNNEIDQEILILIYAYSRFETRMPINHFVLIAILQHPFFFSNDTAQSKIHFRLVDAREKLLLKKSFFFFE